VLLTTQGEIAATCTGRLLHSSTNRGDLPAVGDWVAVRLRTGEARGDIHAVLPRRTKFSRRAPGDPPIEQILAANLDTVLLVTGLDQNFNLRRIERYLAVARESGAQPVVVLNKADLHPDPAAARTAVAAIAGDVPVVVLSALASAPSSLGLASTPGGGETLDAAWPVPVALAPWLRPGRTLALLGSSGVGKSTLINRLLGTERQPTHALSAAVGKGRHTTARRELILAPSGALVIDTPGLRELQLWDVAADALDDTFADVVALAAHCRFHDCAHEGEPGCAVQAALATGALAPARWASFEKLRREQAYAARRADPRLDRENKAFWKKIHRAQRALYRVQDGD
jgi:ribosome biogenesis GTPase